MPRNLDRRVEAVAPVEDAALRARLDEIIEASLDDDLLSWELDADGSWHKVNPERGVDAQERLMSLAVERGRGGR
jgi:polyphosphate kinase